MAYNDLIELARLCLRQASAARTPAAANELRRMAREYQARADGMLKEQRPETADRAIGRPAPEAPSSGVQPATAASLGEGQRRNQVLTLDAEARVIARCPRWERVSCFEQVGRDNDATVADGKN
jgi:hypothetical protein